MRHLAKPRKSAGLPTGPTMNTPRSKPPKRYKRNRAKRTETKLPDGHYRNRLPSNTEQAALLGELVAYWTQVEEQMIEFLGVLLGDRTLPTRQIFRSLPSEQARIKLLTALLEEAPINNDKGPEYDDIIRDFKALNTARNKYVHGLWCIHDSGRIFLAEATPEEHPVVAPRREITADELTTTLRRMGDLWKAILKLTEPELYERLWLTSSPSRPLPRSRPKSS